MTFFTPDGPSPQRSDGSRRQRNPKASVAALLSFVLPGLGHVYIGNARFGFVALSALLVLQLLQLFFLAENFVQLATLIGITVFWQVALTLHATVRAVHIDVVEIQWHRNWYVYPLVIVSVSATMVLAKSHARFNAYRTPSSSMEPNLLPGDYFFADAWHYRRHPIERGDIIVFESPTDGRISIKRCVAVAGDTLEIRSKTLLINGSEQVEPYAIHRSWESQLPQHDRHDFTPRRVVPSGHVFVLGDNRNNSSDSRFWGPLRIDQVRAKATFIYLSIDSEPGLFAARLRRERLGKDLDDGSATHRSMNVN